MAINIDELLAQRYGQGRFNPGAGQTQMSFQEWMDRHPSLQGRGGAQNFDAFSGATSSHGGKNYIEGPRSVGGEVAAPKQFATGPGTGSLTQPPGWNQPNMGREGVDLGTGQDPGLGVSPDQLGGPDKPPMSALNPVQLGGATSTPGGGGYKDFLAKRGVNARKSSAANAAGFRRLNAKKKPGATDSGVNNKQQAH